MSEKLKGEPVSRKERDEARQYLVGYKKPPAETQFKKGKSGNPLGRPPRQSYPMDDFHEVITQRITLKVDGKTKKVSVTTAISMQMVQSALSGNKQDQREVLKLAQSICLPESDRETIDTLEVSDEQRQRILDLFDFYDIRDAFVDLGIFELNGDGRTKISPAALEALVGADYRNNQRESVRQLIQNYLVGTPSL